MNRVKIKSKSMNRLQLLHNIYMYDLMSLIILKHQNQNNVKLLNQNKCQYCSFDVNPHLKEKVDMISLCLGYLSIS